MTGMQAKLREVNAWAQLAKDDNWRQDTDRIDLALPYLVRDLHWDPEQSADWVATEMSFDHMLRQYVRPGLRVLEVGAAKTWAGHYFVERGCEYTGCDLQDDRDIGVGRSRFYRERFGYYEVVAADAEYLPFCDGYFDLTVAIAALHHALDLYKMVGEMARVTKKGGTVIGLNEGTRAFWERSEAEMQTRAMELGINEHVHTLWGYRRAFQRSGLRVTEMTRSIGYERSIAPRLRLMLSPLLHFPRMGQALVTWLLLGAIHSHDGVNVFGDKR
jgi:ubiquinone/menaquinone biosynthesis C-methylase UbiE